MDILWLAPHLNHYKARFLNRWAATNEVKLTVLCGHSERDLGHVELKHRWIFNIIRVKVRKARFAFSIEIFQKLWVNVGFSDWVMLPAEKKNIPLLLYLVVLRSVRRDFRIFSYNHSLTTSNKRGLALFDVIVTKIFYILLDRVIFYTEESFHYAVDNGLIRPGKAFWANNTLDSIEISKYSSVQPPNADRPTILFIGRLIRTKKIDVLFDAFEKIKERLPSAILEVVGDGPSRKIIETRAEMIGEVVWHGSIVDEQTLMPIMERAWMVFVPGHSGLSVNHALFYGRPYVTLKGIKHAPEISYIKNGVNGFLLEPDLEIVIECLYKILTDYNRVLSLCAAAKESSKNITVEHWIDQVNTALLK